MCVWRGWKGSWVGRVSGTVGSVVVREVVGVQRRTFLKSEMKSQNETESTKLLAVAEL